MHLSSIGVFCASSEGKDPALSAAAHTLGESLARAGKTIVYGGASVGLMGRLADAAMAAGGEVHGVIPRALVDREIAHPGLTRLDIVDSMHERKARMAALSDAFVALPGGLGTLDEFVEIVTWSQLNIHSKPCYLVNLDGYYHYLLAFLRGAVSCGLLRQENYDRIQVVSGVEELLESLVYAKRIN